MSTHFVRIGGSAVHVRLEGRGPVCVLSGGNVNLDQLRGLKWN